MCLHQVRELYRDELHPKKSLILLFLRRAPKRKLSKSSFSTVDLPLARFGPYGNEIHLDFCPMPYVVENVAFFFFRYSLAPEEYSPSSFLIRQDVLYVRAKERCQNIIFK